MVVYLPHLPSFSYGNCPLGDHPQIRGMEISSSKCLGCQSRELRLNSRGGQSRMEGCKCAQGKQMQTNVDRGKKNAEVGRKANADKRLHTLQPFGFLTPLLPIPLKTSRCDNPEPEIFGGESDPPLKLVPIASLKRHMIVNGQIVL